MYFQNGTKITTPQIQSFCLQRSSASSFCFWDIDIWSWLKTKRAPLVAKWPYFRWRNFGAVLKIHKYIKYVKIRKNALFWKMLKCKFLKIPQWPDFEILCGDSWHLSHTKKLDGTDGGFNFWKIAFSGHVVDRPTQLICISDIYLWYLCQQTNTKDIAG